MLPIEQQVQDAWILCTQHCAVASSTDQTAKRADVESLSHMPTGLLRQRSLCAKGRLDYTAEPQTLDERACCTQALLELFAHESLTDGAVLAVNGLLHTTTLRQLMQHAAALMCNLPSAGLKYDAQHSHLLSYLLRHCTSNVTGLLINKSALRPTIRTEALVF